MEKSLKQPNTRSFQQQLASFILAQCESILPDLSQVHIFIPNALSAHQLRLQLSQQAGCALMGPYIGSMQQWLTQHIALPNAGTQIINQPARQLLLLEALYQHPDLFREENAWQVCDSLLSLFDELNQASNGHIDDSEQAWRQRLQQAYGDGGLELQQLNHEARIVHTLWRAWQQQTQALELLDESQAYLLRLAQGLEAISPEAQFFVVGPEQLTTAETQWLNRLSGRCHEQSIVQNQPPGVALDRAHIIQQQASHSAFLTAAFQLEQPLLQRADAYHQLDTNNLQPHLFAAKSAEQEALALELQIRIWLLDGVQNIGIVTEDRKLARRVRALLERSGIRIQDTAGWSLATTSSATVVERWLECIEQDFAYQPLLDLLKSPFFSDPELRDQHLALVYRLEQDVILHENIAGDIQRYIRALHDRARRMHSHWPDATYQSLQALLELLANTAQPLSKLYRQNTSGAPADYLNRLIESLKSLNIYQNLAADMAGIRILKVLDNMLQGLNHASPSMDWADFRSWLGNSLEQEEFTLQDLAAPVQLMNMKQAQYCQFDALIIAAANKDSLPGAARQSPFFNQAVRQSLGLKSWPDDIAYGFYQFKSLLESAPRVLLSYKAEQDGEWLPPSPWVSSLQDFAELALNVNLQDQQLAQLLAANLTLTECDTNQPASEQIQPLPVMTAEQLPNSYSASRHQRLIDCPYKFFATDGLSLKAREDISEELQKADYGEKVHLILQAFHQQVDKMPKPFNKPLNKEHRELAISHMENLSRIIFQQDLEDTVQHRGWLQRWLKTIPEYIDWQIKQQQLANIYQLEQRKTQSLACGLELNGRLDRIDKNDDGYILIDYKTGKTASQKDIEQGEDVQLLSYAALMEQVNKIAYLSLDNGVVKVPAKLEDEQLHELSDMSRQRLIEMNQQLKNGSALPAWGDEKTCGYCDMKGLCRKQVWEVG
ncbi:MAG: PD-(D/E)XK nuclease family protein [Gammaproteobacteria bacterium]|nr:PD-(D/E)XK nuclease family protein [Gammaproteobacteria bacterium]